MSFQVLTLHRCSYRLALTRACAFDPRRMSTSRTIHVVVFGVLSFIQKVSIILFLEDICGGFGFRMSIFRHVPHRMCRALVPFQKFKGCSSLVKVGSNTGLKSIMYGSIQGKVFLVLGFCQQDCEMLYLVKVCLGFWTLKVPKVTLFTQSIFFGKNLRNYIIP